MTIEEAREYLGEEQLAKNRMMTDADIIATAESMERYFMEEDGSFFDTVEGITFKPKQNNGKN